MRCIRSDAIFFVQNLWSLNEDFGMSNQPFRIHFRSTFQRFVGQIEDSHPWKALRKRILKGWFGLPKASFGRSKVTLYVYRSMHTAWCDFLCTKSRCMFTDAVHQVWCDFLCTKSRCMFTDRCIWSDAMRCIRSDAIFFVQNHVACLQIDACRAMWRPNNCAISRPLKGV